MHDRMSLAAHDDEVGPLLGSRLLQLGRRTVTVVPPVMADLAITGLVFPLPDLQNAMAPLGGRWSKG
jgi:hypothetical protein